MQQSSDATTAELSPLTPGDWGQFLDHVIARRFGDLVALRRHLHSYPEPSGREYQTSAYLDTFLAPQKFEIRRGPERRGLIVDPPQTTAEPRIAIRADLDALYINDKKECEYRSRVPGVMHACGHDGHTATVAGAALALHEAQSAGALPWPVAWRAIFQPAEETSKGAHEMIEAGALDGVQAVLGLHMDPARPSGTIGYRHGPLTASCDEMEVRIQGRGGHAARPHESIDPIAAAAQLISSIYLFVPRGTDSHDPVVVTFGQIIAGDNPNVIPEHVTLRGTVRTLGGATRERTKEHVRQLARGLDEASGAKIAVEFLVGTSAVNNDTALTDLIREAAADVLDLGNVHPIARPSMGGEDFSHYLDRVPGAMFRLGCAPSSTPAAPLHSPEFDLDERAIALGARILARAVVLWSNPARHLAEANLTEASGG
jgi:amidohydrolase